MLVPLYSRTRLFWIEEIGLVQMLIYTYLTLHYTTLTYLLSFPTIPSHTLLYPAVLSRITIYNLVYPI